MVEESVLCTSASAHSIMSNVWCFHTVEPYDLARFTVVCLALSDDEKRSV